MLEKAKTYTKENNLSLNNQLEKKILELNETLDVRFGTVIIGEAMTGKTELIKTLMNSKNLINYEYRNQNS